MASVEKRKEYEGTCPIIMWRLRPCCACLEEDYRGLFGVAGIILVGEMTNLDVFESSVEKTFKTRTCHRPQFFPAL